MKDTICALATPPGGALGIIRLSGPDAFSVTHRVCRRITATTAPRTAVLSPILLADGEVLDEAVVTLYPPLTATQVRTA